MNKQDVIKIVIGLVSFGTFIYACVNEFDFIVNTLYFKNLLIYALIAGLIVAGLLLFKFMPDIQLFEKFMLIMAALVILILTMPLLASISNRWLGQRTPIVQSFELIRMEARSEQPFGILDSTAVHMDAWRAHVRLSDGQSSFYIKKGLNFTSTQDSIFLPMKKGFWGFTYLDVSQR